MDHDLSNSNARCRRKRYLRHPVIQAIIQYFSRDILMLVHSMNYEKGVGLLKTLTSNAFPEHSISKKQMTEELFKGWLAECWEKWEACD